MAGNSFGRNYRSSTEGFVSGMCHTITPYAYKNAILIQKTGEKWSHSSDKQQTIMMSERLVRQVIARLIPQGMNLGPSDLRFNALPLEPSLQLHISRGDIGSNDQLH